MDISSSAPQRQPSSFSNDHDYFYDDRATEANTAANAAPSPYQNDYQQRDGYLDASQQQQQQQRFQSPSGRFTEEWDASQRGSSIIEGHNGAHNKHISNNNMQRSDSVHSFNAGDDQQLPARGNTLKKRNSVRRSMSLKRSGSRRSMRAGSVKSLALQSTLDPDEARSAFYCPVPTSGSPTDILSDRFQAWRKVLKDLITYFREIQSHYEHKSKSLVKLANVSNNISTPNGFLPTAGIDDALQFLRAYNKSAIVEATKAREIEEDVILALTGLRSDLQQKIKEIKNLSGDFKNSVGKEMDHTRKAVKSLSEILGKTEVDESSTTGKQDPYLLRLAVDRQVERQIDEENYLHQAYLNLESSGRELESIVVGEIQKAYNAYAGILKREADNSYNVVEELRSGPISMPKDQEWMHFVTEDASLVDPSIPLRTAEQIHYPGQDHESAQEIRAGLLERKSKYLKSYTAGWYVLSATHLHEFKSADKAQAPVMSLYLPEQKLGSHSEEGGSSNKFILKGRQTGTMHRGHTWVFRAESHDTMMAWYEDIKALTEKTPEERSQFVRSHSRSLSRSSTRRSVSSDGLLDEDEDEEPFSADHEAYINPGPKHDSTPRRSLAGGRFPSDIQVNAQRGLQAPHSPSSVSSAGIQDRRQNPATIAAAGAVAVAGGAAAGTYYLQNHSQENHYGSNGQTDMEEVPSHAAVVSNQAQLDGVNPYTGEPIGNSEYTQQQQNHHQHYEDPCQNANYAVPVMMAQNQQPLESQAINGDQQQQEQSNYNFEQQQNKNTEGYGGMQDQHVMNGASGGDNYNTFAVPPTGFSNYTIENQDAQQHGLNGGLGGSRKYQPEPIQQAEAIPTPPPAPIPVPAGTMKQDDQAFRPTGYNTRNDSIQTISNLHIPGGYPKSATT